jgi:hypothetical protein
LTPTLTGRDKRGQTPTLPGPFRSLAISINKNPSYFAQERSLRLKTKSYATKIRALRNTIFHEKKKRKREKALDLYEEGED